MDKLDSDILEALTGGAVLDTAIIANHVGRSEADTRAALERLRSDGKVTVEDDVWKRASPI